MDESNCCGAVMVNGICGDCGENATPIKYNCEICKDTGVYAKDEWTDTDTSYEVTRRCICLED